MDGLPQLSLAGVEKMDGWMDGIVGRGEDMYPI
jgi:hypothetical protein